MTFVNFHIFWDVHNIMNKILIIALAIIVIIIIAALVYYFFFYNKGPWVSEAAYKDGGGTIWTVNADGVSLTANRATENQSTIDTVASTLTFKPSNAVYAYAFDSANNFSIVNTKSPYQKDNFTKIV